MELFFVVEVVVEAKTKVVHGDDVSLKPRHLWLGGRTGTTANLFGAQSRRSWACMVLSHMCTCMLGAWVGRTVLWGYAHRGPEE